MEYVQENLHLILSLPCVYLEGGIGVAQKLSEVSLEPLASLRCGLESIGVAAVSIVSDSGGIRSTIALASWLDPDVRIEKWVIGG